MGAAELTSNAVLQTSQKQYELPWARWMTFLEAYLGEKPTDEDSLLVGKSNREGARRLAVFVHYLYTDIKLAPGTICSYLSAVRHHFRTNFQDLDFFLNPSLRACKTALKLRHLATAAIDDNEKNKRRLPFSADMLIALVATLDIHKIEDAMMITALYMGFCMLLRASEYLYDEAAISENRSHAFLAKDVEFISHEGGIYPATRAHTLPWTQVSMIRLTLRSAKNDKFRIGRVSWFRAGRHKIGNYDFVELLYGWAVRAKLDTNSVFLSFFNTNTKVRFPLKTYRVRDAVKRGALAFGFSTDNYGCHSLRIGGACALRAAGASESMIQLYGRWQSEPSCLGYQAASSDEFDAMLGMLSNIGAYTSQDIRLNNARSNMLHNA
jgi:hypothetical protein